VAVAQRDLALVLGRAIVVRGAGHEVRHEHGVDDAQP